jgi:plasmid stability protein
MATLTIRNIPQSVYDALVRRAKRRGRSINSEVIYQLEASLGERDIDINEELAEIRRFRATLGEVFVTENDINRFKREGRP